MALGYDAVFHFGQWIDPTAIKSYVDGGGNAYISLGSGWYGTAGGEAAHWNPMLATYGLVAGSSWFTAAGFVQATVTVGPSSALIWGYGQSIEKLPGSLTSQSYIRGKFSPTGEEIGLVGASRALLTSAVPEPASWGLMILGFAAVGAGLRRQRRVVSFG
ncbi:MAG: PEPxxWA-CTERM sorting domain-containing protein [Sphingomonadales bacterium]|nr:PEPxxWA-CTERM sorting domain-containing protein [Sphingomonadales bacterium]